MKYKAAATSNYILDTRYKKASTNDFPVRLRFIFKVNDSYVVKHLPTKFRLTEKEFKLIKGKKPGDELKEIRNELNALIAKADGIISSMPFFSWERFKEEFGMRSRNVNLLSVAFADYIKELQTNNQEGTAVAYGNAKNNLESFWPGATLHTITVDELNRYELQMKLKGLSLNTIGMYLRSLRALFNRAIEKGRISRDHYPFGKFRYKIRKGPRKRIALPLADIKRIFDYQPQPGTFDEMARDLFVFMYLCNGANPYDTLLLKYSDIDGNVIRFYRKKTARTNNNPKEIKATLTPAMISIIRKWGNEQHPDNYIFPVLKPGMNEEQKYKADRDFINKMNKQLKKIGKSCGIEKSLSNSVARHSFGTVLKRSGKNKELIGEMMGHSTPEVTDHYLGEYEDSHLQAASDELVNFNSITPAKVVGIR